MIRIKYPEPEFRIKKTGESAFIFDPIRRKWLLLTSEEWVRQNFVQYLIKIMEYPASLIALEKKIKLGELTKRFDILVYDNAHQPWMMVECKSGDVPLNDDVLSQALRYNISIPVPYLVITNGDYCFAFSRKESGLEPLGKIPCFGE